MAECCACLWERLGTCRMATIDAIRSSDTHLVSKRRRGKNNHGSDGHHKGPLEVAMESPCVAPCGARKWDGYIVDRKLFPMDGWNIPIHWVPRGTYSFAQIWKWHGNVFLLQCPWTNVAFWNIHSENRPVDVSMTGSCGQRARWAPLFCWVGLGLGWVTTIYGRYGYGSMLIYQ